MNRIAGFLPPVAVRVVMAVLVVAAAAVLLRGDGPDPVVVTAEFERAGLNVRPGDEVRARGIPVGRIASIEIDRDDFSATYELRLDPGVAIAADTTARLVPKTLFGDKYVELQPAADGEDTLADGAHLGAARTEPPTELQSVLDRLEPTLDELDPVALAATMSSLATAFGDAAPDFRRVMDEAPGVADAIVAAQDELAAVLAATPGVAGTVADHADRLVSAADHFAALADLVAGAEPELAAFLSGTVELSQQAASLLSEEQATIDAVLAQGTAVLGVVSARPGAITALLDGAPRFVNGLAAATATGPFRSPLANFVILNAGSLLSSPGAFGEAEGGAGIGPDVVVEGLDLPRVTADPTDPAGVLTSSVDALTTLLRPLLGDLGGGG